MLPERRGSVLPVLSPQDSASHLQSQQEPNTQKRVVSGPEGQSQTTSSIIASNPSNGIDNGGSERERDLSEVIQRVGRQSWDQTSDPLTATPGRLPLHPTCPSSRGFGFPGELPRPRAARRGGQQQSHEFLPVCPISTLHPLHYKSRPCLPIYVSGEHYSPFTLQLGVSCLLIHVVK